MFKMLRKLLPFLDSFLELNYYERLKFMFLGGMSFCVVASNAPLYSAQNIVFFNLVGNAHKQYANYLMVATCFPVIYLYTMLIDRVKRETLIHIIFISCALICFIFAYFLINSTIGLFNSGSGPHPLLGWIFYIIINVCSLVIMPTLWSFKNAVSTPTSALNGYAFMDVLSRIGGCIAFEALNKTAYKSLNQLSLVPFILIIVGVLLLLVSIFAFCITTFIPKKHLEGYQPEAQLQAQKDKILTTTQTAVPFVEKTINSLTAQLKGLRLLISNPYVFGILGIAYCSHIILKTLDYQVTFLKNINPHDSFPSSGIFTLSPGALFHTVGLFLAVFALTSLLKKYGIPFCLMITPAVTMILIGGLFIYPSLFVLRVIDTFFCGFNYGFDYPIREMLFIPTSQDIKYKANLWIEFTTRSFSRTSGTMTDSISPQAANFAMMFGSLFSLLVALVWLILAYLVGRKYELAVKNNRVIGRNA